MSMKIYSCGMCGAPCLKSGYVLNFITANYNPYNHEHVYCEDCGRMEVELQQYITREMALDAGMPEIEGMCY